MKRIITTGAGGSGGIAFANAFRNLDEEFFLIGLDSNKYKIHRAKTDVSVLVPPARDPNYIAILADIVREFKADFFHVQTSIETLEVSKYREQIPCLTFLPTKETITTSADKLKCFHIWKAGGITVPETLKIDTEEDLKSAFAELGPKLWLRFQQGSAGIGSLPTDNFERARLWINEINGWGKFLAAICLEPRTTTFESIWQNGELVVAQQRERLYWEHSNRAPSGVTGVTGTSLTVNDPLITDIAIKAIKLIDKQPNGILGVDFTYDTAGFPNPTEINAGRFMSTHGFFTTAGVNFPLIFVKSAFNEQIPEIPSKVNPLPAGLVWIRGMDTTPFLGTISNVNDIRATLANRINRLE